MKEKQMLKKNEFIYIFLFMIEILLRGELRRRPKGAQSPMGLMKKIKLNLSSSTK